MYNQIMSRDIKFIHYTLEKNTESILIEGFRKSIHGPRSCQWVGDGVYFFDDSDIRSALLGCSILHNKIENKGQVIEISSLEFDINPHDYFFFDICDEEDFKELLEFIDYYIENTFPKGSRMYLKMQDQFAKLLDKFKKKQSFDNYVGSFLGIIINNYILSVDDRIQIASMAFYPNDFYRYKKTGPYGRIELPPVNQFCIRDLKIIPSELIKKHINEKDIQLW